jgi:hypothetical protein
MKWRMTTQTRESLINSDNNLGHVQQPRRFEVAHEISTLLVALDKQEFDSLSPKHDRFLIV